MPTTAALPSTLPAKPPVKRLHKISSKSPQPSLRFQYSKSLRAKTLAVLNTLERAEDGTDYRDALANIVVELTDSGMDYYFLKPLKIAKAGFFTEQSAGLGMKAVTGLLGTVIRNFIGSMDGPQLLSVCSYIRQLME